MTLWAESGNSAEIYTAHVPSATCLSTKLRARLAIRWRWSASCKAKRSTAHTGRRCSHQADGFREDFDASPCRPGVRRAESRWVSRRTAPGRVVCRQDGLRVVAVLSPSVCAHGYVVTKRGARRLASTVLPVREPYDAFLRNVHRHKCMIFETSPWLVRASKDAAESSIGGNRRPLRATSSLSKTLRSAAFRLEYNVMKRLFNLRRFGLAYITRSGFMSLPG